MTGRGGGWDGSPVDSPLEATHGSGRSDREGCSSAAGNPPLIAAVIKAAVPQRAIPTRLQRIRWRRTPRVGCRALGVRPRSLIHDPLLLSRAEKYSMP